MSHREWLAGVVAVVLCLPQYLLAAGESGGQPDGSIRASLVDESLLERPTIPVAVVTVDRVEGDHERRTATLRVKKALRGRFPPESFPVVLAFPESAPPARIEVLPVAKSGEPWIAFFSPTESVPTHMIEAHRSSAELLDFVTAHLAPGDRSAVIQLPVLLLIIALPFFARALFRRIPKAIVLTVPLQLGLYSFYESGISPYTNIRADLLLVIPAVVWNFIVVGRALAAANKAG